MIQFRPYQERAVEAALTYAAEHPTGRLCVVVPPRGGKTFIGAGLVEMMALRHSLRALWIAHREELLDEARSHLIACGIRRSRIGTIKAGHAYDPDLPMQVASDATLDRRDKPVAHIVVTDEAHRDTAARRRRIRKAYPRAFLLGLTGTPIPPPGRDLGEDFDAMLVVVQPSELIHDGYLAVPTIFAPDQATIPDLRGLRVVGGDYRPEDLEPLLLRQSMLDEHVREWARLAEGRATIAYPVTRAHSRAVVDRFKAAGIMARHLDGDTPTEERRSILAALRAGALPVVSSPGVLSDGTNLPEAKCVMGLRPTASLTLYIQQSLRCATPWNDVRPRLLDGVGNVYRHGHPHADRFWGLRDPKNGEPIGGRAPVKRCPKCSAIVSAGAASCANCLFVFPAPKPVVPDVPLELHEVLLRDAELEKERARLLAYATSRGFENPKDWTERVLAAKQGAAA